MTALTLFMFILAFVVCAIDVRLLWLKLFIFLPQQLSDNMPSSEESSAAAKLKILQGVLQIAQLSCIEGVVCQS
jgi:hypothetical protein